MKKSNIILTLTMFLGIVYFILPLFAKESFLNPYYSSVGLLFSILLFLLLIIVGFTLKLKEAVLVGKFGGDTESRFGQALSISKTKTTTIGSGHFIKLE